MAAAAAAPANAQPVIYKYIIDSQAAGVALIQYIREGSDWFKDAYRFDIPCEYNTSKEEIETAIKRKITDGLEGLDIERIQLIASSIDNADYQDQLAKASARFQAR